MEQPEFAETTKRMYNTQLGDGSNVYLRFLYEQAKMLKESGELKGKAKADIAKHIERIQKKYSHQPKNNGGGPNYESNSAVADKIESVKKYYSEQLEKREKSFMPILNSQGTLNPTSYDSSKFGT